MKSIHHRSRRIYLLRPSWPQLFLFAGVILFGLIFLPQPVSAMGSDKFEIKPPEPTLIQQNDQKIKELEASFKTEQEKLEEKLEAVEEVKEQAQAIVQTAQQLEAEVLDMREEVKVLEAKLAEKKRLEAERTVPASRNADDSAGNTYALGNCTHYVKQRRPDLSNSFGNANEWYYNAKAMGYKTGTMSKKGAVGTTTRGRLGHVVYVEKWLGNGRILISEMNVGGLWHTQTVEADESDFVYIYNL